MCLLGASMVTYNFKRFNPNANGGVEHKRGMEKITFFDQYLGNDAR